MRGECDGNAVWGNRGGVGVVRAGFKYLGAQMFKYLCLVHTTLLEIR